MGVAKELGKLGRIVTGKPVETTLGGKIASGAGSIIGKGFEYGGKAVAFPFKLFGWAGGGVMKGSAKLGLKTAEMPFTFVMKGVNSVALHARNHPWIAGGLALGAGAMAVGSNMRSHAAQRTEENLMRQATGSQPAYGLAPGEYDATVAPRLKAGAQPAFASDVQASRAASTQNAVS